MSGTARSQSTDPFLLNRFHVTDTEGFLNLTSPAGGFQTCTMPTITLETHEYSEGVWTYRRKYPGTATFDDITLTKGVVKNDTSFFKWLLAGAENHPYRSNIVIKHFHRDDVSGLLDYTQAKPYRELICYNALPINSKPASDFDAMASDISIEEMGIAFEYFRLKINGVEVVSPT
jgi:phage tail-like protein